MGKEGCGRVQTSSPGSPVSSIFFPSGSNISTFIPRDLPWSSDEHQRRQQQQQQQDQQAQIHLQI